MIRIKQNHLYESNYVAALLNRTRSSGPFHQCVSPMKKLLGRSAMGMHEKKACQSIRTVSDISRGDLARIPTCSLQTAIDRFKGNSNPVGLNVCYSKSYYHFSCPQIIKLHKNSKYLKFEIIYLPPPLNALCIMWAQNQNNASLPSMRVIVQIQRERDHLLPGVFTQGIPFMWPLTRHVKKKKNSLFIFRPSTSFDQSSFHSMRVQLCRSQMCGRSTLHTRLPT